MGGLAGVPSLLRVPIHELFITLFISQVTWTPILLASVWDKPNPFRVNPANLGPPPCLGVREAPRHGGGGGWGCLVFPCHRCPLGPAEMHVIPIGLAPSPPLPSASWAPIRVSALPRGFLLLSFALRSFCLLPFQSPPSLKWRKNIFPSTLLSSWLRAL